MSPKPASTEKKDGDTSAVLKKIIDTIVSNSDPQSPRPVIIMFASCAAHQTTKNKNDKKKE